MTQKQSRPSLSTNAVSSTSLQQRCRRGSAEIELLIVITILLSLIMLVSGTLSIGGTRMTTAQYAAFSAFNDATAANPPLYAGNIQPVAGIANIRPILPNRVHSTDPTARVSGFTGGDGGAFTATIGARAATIGPTWAYSAYPIGGSDQAVLQDWFEECVLDAAAIDSSARSALGLAAPWQP